MKPQSFDLNDILHEPSDEQLDALMEAVAVEARRNAQAAREQLMVRSWQPALVSTFYLLIGRRARLARVSILGLDRLVYKVLWP